MNEVENASDSFDLIATDIARTVKELKTKYNLTTEEAIEITKATANTITADTLWRRLKELNNNIEQLSDNLEELADNICNN